MNDISNLTKPEALEFLTYVVCNNVLDGELTEALKANLESAIRVAIAHLSEDDTNKVATAVEAIFQMYRRNDVADKSYRNAARFILSSVDGVPNRYEMYDCIKEDTRLSNLTNNKQEDTK